VETLRRGSDLLFLACGSGVRRSLEAAALLEEHGHSVTVANVRRVRPLDVPVLCGLIEAHPAVVTVEENALAGGFGSSILELMQEEGLLRPCLRVGLPDRFVEHGDLPRLYREVGFTGAAIAVRAESLLARLEVVQLSRSLQE
jgi:1-deoxy-D-xylulose-5-phosphate synthase